MHFAYIILKTAHVSSLNETIVNSMIQTHAYVGSNTQSDITPETGYVTF